MIEINIVYASDDNFAEFLGISVISLLESSHDCSSIHIYVLDGGISADNREKISSITDSFGCRLSFVPASDMLDSDMKQQRGSLSTFARLYAAELLPDDIDRILYLDCDILVLDDLTELYRTDISGYYCAGVRDCISRQRLAQNGLSPDDVYVNAGVMLIDLCRWRTENVSAEFERVSESYGGDVPYADQGIINGAFRGGIKSLPPGYNCYTALYDFSYDELMIFRKPPVYYSEKEIEEAKAAPAIVHFTTSFLSLRPWTEGSRHPYAGRWAEIKRRSPWADISFRADMRSGSRKAAVKLFRLLPRKLAVMAVGILHSIIIPVLKTKKR